MARIGDNINAGLLKTNFNAYLAGAQQGAAAMGRGIASAGQSIAEGLKQQQQAKKDVDGAANMFKSMAEVYGENTDIGRSALNMYAQISDQDTPLRQRHALAASGTKTLNMLMHKAEVDTANRFRERGLRVSEGGLKLQQDEYLDRAKERREDAVEEAEIQEARNRGYMAGAGQLPQAEEEPQGFWGKVGSLLGARPEEDARGGGEMTADLIEEHLGVDPDPKLLGAFLEAHAEGQQARSKGRKEEWKAYEFFDHNTGEWKKTNPVPWVDGRPQLSQQDIAAAGPKATARPGKAEESFNRREQQYFEWNNTTIESGPKVDAGIAQAEHTLNLLRNGVDTGFGKQALYQFKRTWEGITGYKTDANKFEQVAVGLGEHLMSQMQRMTGVLSDNDIKMLRALSPGLNKTTEGNIKIMEFFLQAKQKERRLSALAHKLRMEGKLTEGQIYAEVRKANKEEHLWAKEEQGTDEDPSGLGGF